jgi:hypothetical protein
MVELEGSNNNFDLFSDSRLIHDQQKWYGEIAINLCSNFRLIRLIKENNTSTNIVESGRKRIHFRNKTDQTVYCNNI